jgi:hypothetical protein
VLIDGIRLALAFWEVAVIMVWLYTGRNLVVLFPAYSRFLGVWVKLLKELHQPVDQPASPSDHMQTALVLVLFQDFVQAAFQLIHTAPPQLGSSCFADIPRSSSEARLKIRL